MRSAEDEQSAHDLALVKAVAPSCSLDKEGLRAQRMRHARLAPSVLAMERRDRALSITFSASLDRRALDELIAVERECCPFFEFDFEEPRCRLTVSVREAAEVPALDAVAAALETR